MSRGLSCPQALVFRTLAKTLEYTKYMNTVTYIKPSKYNTRIMRKLCQDMSLALESLAKK